MNLLFWITKGDTCCVKLISLTYSFSDKDWEIHQQMTIFLSTAQEDLTKHLPYKASTYIHF